MSQLTSNLLTLSVVFFLSGSVTAFSAAVNTLKSHRVMEQLQKLFPLFFYLSLHKRWIGKNIEGLKSVISICRTLMNYTFASFVFLTMTENRLWQGWGDGVSSLADGLYLLTATLGSFVLTDTLPKALGFRWPHLALQLCSVTTSVVCTLFLVFTYPLTRLFHWAESNHPMSPMDPTVEIRERVMEVLYEFEIDHPADWQNRKLLQGLVKYQDRVVREIMVPRVEIFSLNAQTPVNEAATKILQEGFTRVPVYEDNIDNIIGVIMAKDLLKTYLEAQLQNTAHLNASQTIASIVKPVLFTPEHRRVSALLQDFRKKHVHLAIVVDEYGGTEGLVSIEDILEEIVGDIEDEYDLQEKPYTLISDGSYVVDAHISIFDLHENLGIDLPSQEGYDTLSGYIFAKVGSIPTRGLVIHQNDFDLEILECSERSVESVRIRPHPS
jgi:putative hemolysin